MEMRHHVTDMAEVSTLVPLAVPWGYVLREYITATGDPWNGRGSGPRQTTS
jgi:hypothetical protein